MTLADLEARVSNDEFLRWRAFFAWEVWKQEQAAMEARMRSAQ